ncbi:ATP-binding protein [Suttonella ornithocola]|uniref:DNA mismatch repair protein n=1 Tax=Suttonella ornithocola TaxID=279832 RepID=A0A380MZ25_9GAMM|nr:ATP-binding protein [Suttonella ornithocola]SUO96707.1 DNA mismatch repair protein [Suttonella ornithocola]
MDNKYRMTVDLNVLEHLGINLYSNLSAVLTEIVANAWDADASKIQITIDENTPCQFIEIFDDGKGITSEEMNEKFLKVGYRRRLNSSDPEAVITASGRPVMGRKGLGKLALFSVADSVIIQSMGADGIAHGLTMETQAIRDAIKNNQAEYNPPFLPQECLTIKEKGTFIRLEKINNSRIKQTINSLKKRLARRFSVYGDKFKIIINHQEITMKDRDDIENTRFLWLLGGKKIDVNI